MNERLFNWIHRQCFIKILVEIWKELWIEKAEQDSMWYEKRWSEDVVAQIHTTSNIIDEDESDVCENHIKNSKMICMKVILNTVLNTEQRTQRLTE